MAPRIAVLGCGYWGGNHIRTLKGLGVLQGVSDANPQNAERFASEFGVPNIPILMASFWRCLRSFMRNMRLKQ